MDPKWEQLKSWIDESSDIVFFGGAGVSTESGIPDFRGNGGLYRQESAVPLETVLSHDYFVEHPEGFYRLHRNSALRKGTVRPNAAHKRLAELEQQGKLKAVITQNIDGLHQAAGSKNVLELHGNERRYYCMDCGRTFAPEQVDESEELVPRCSCGGVIRPDVVLYGEALDGDVLDAALRAVASADLLIVGGTSLVVYPAAGLVRYFGGKHLVLINADPTPYDGKADLIIRDKIGEVFAAI